MWSMPGSCHSFTQRPCPQSQSEALLPTQHIWGDPRYRWAGNSNIGETLEPLGLFQV